MFLFLFLFVTSVYGVLPPPDYVNCDNTRGAVLECASTLFDVDHDGRITADEIDQVLPTLVSLPSPDRFRSKTLAMNLFPFLPLRRGRL